MNSPISTAKIVALILYLMAFNTFANTDIATEPEAYKQPNTKASTGKTHDKQNAATEQETAKESAISQRVVFEQSGNNNPFLILPHRPNYFLPFTYNDEPNELRVLGEDVELDKLEAKFQISFKLPLWDDIFKDNGDLYFAYTQLALWQIYNTDLSSPFRDTNYEPEFFLSFDTDFRFAGLTNRYIQIGLVHQSNGRSDPISRSWNRVYLNFIAEHKNLVVSFKPWYRLPEDDIDDDNPDIDDFYGNAEFGIAYKRRRQVFAVMLRNNFDTDDNNGAIEISWDFPLSGKLRGYVQYFNGYGETLLDYNRSVNRIGFGVAMSSWL